VGAAINPHLMGYLLNTWILVGAVKELPHQSIPVRLSKILTPIQYILIILKYYDYNMPLSVF
jgi:hypothetical protein